MMPPVTPSKLEDYIWTAYRHLRNAQISGTASTSSAPNQSCSVSLEYVDFTEGSDIWISGAMTVI